MLMSVIAVLGVMGLAASIAAAQQAPAPQGRGGRGGSAGTGNKGNGDWNGADYLSDVMFPKHIVQKRGTATVMDLTRDSDPKGPATRNRVPYVGAIV